MTWDQIERKWGEMARRVQTQWDQASSADATKVRVATPDSKTNDRPSIEAEPALPKQVN